MKSYSIGLDIGIASVGWSIIDTESGHIEDLGVNLFTARNSDSNTDRRNARGARRLLRRRVTRLSDCRKLLNNYGFEEDKSIAHVSPYELRVKGLAEALTTAELFKVVMHIVKKRGISYLDEDAEAESGTSGSDYKKQVEENNRLLHDLTPGQIQLTRLKENGRVKTGINQNGEYKLNVFTVHAYAKELRKILDCQKKFHDTINDEFIELLCRKDIGEKAGLIYRKRPYYHGPGNAQNPSPYGRWAKYEQDGHPQENIFSQLIGTDLLGELRASSLSPTAQIYNFLNDVNNLSLPREESKLTSQEKEAFLVKLMTEDKTFGPSTLAKELGFKVEEIKGWRIDPKKKPLLHTLKPYRNWKKIFADNNIEIKNIPIEILDEIASIITLNTEKDAIESTLDINLPNLSQNIREVVIQEFKSLKKADSTSTWHSFSLKTMNLLIPELKHTSEEQNTILERLGLKKEWRNEFADKSTIPINEVLEEIYNPTVSRSVRKAITVLNCLVRKYGKDNIAYVTIEMPRDKNEKEEKDRISKNQKENVARKDFALKYFREAIGWDDVRLESELYRNKRLREKINYYAEQDGKCAYSGKHIQPLDLINAHVTEIDHIIPLSISLDDSINNKVLVLASANQEKAQRTPYQAFNEGAKMGQSFAEYEVWVKSRKFNSRKEQNLLDERDIFNPEVQQQFVNRNLNDTRYASRTVLNAVQSFFNKQDTKVKVINGAYTHTLRKKWHHSLEKTRDTHHHHAVDATLCAVSPFVKASQFEYRYNEEEKKAYMVDTTTGELIPYNKYKKGKYYDRRSYVPEWDNFIPKLIPTEINSRIKFAHQVDKKVNRKLADATLYSTREKTSVEIKRGKEVENTETYVIGKIKDIYTTDGYEQFKKNRENLLMKDIDPKTYKILCEIADTYPDKTDTVDQSGKVKTVSVSPFKMYADDHQVVGVQRYSKKGNGPVVRSLKYYDKKLGNHINITKDSNGKPINQNSNKRKVILQSLNPWRTDVYQNPDTGDFHLLGIKYNHLKFMNDKYGVPLEVYNDLKVAEGIEDTFIFCFSLYRNDLIQIEFENETLNILFHSRTLNMKNYCELKAIHKKKWLSKESIKILGESTGNGQLLKPIKPSMKLRKLSTDPLGNIQEIKSEKLTHILK